MALMAQYNGAKIEDRFEEYEQAVDELDSLQRNLKFIETEYEGDDQLELRAVVHEKIEVLERVMENMSAPMSLSKLSKENAEVCEDMIVMMVNTLRSFFIVDRMITSEGIKGLAPLVVTSFPELTLEDIAVCLNEAKRGVYGEVYARLDGAVIMRWLTEYSKRRVESRSLRQVNKHLQTKDNGYRDPDQKDNQVALQKAISLRQIEKAARENKK